MTPCLLHFHNVEHSKAFLNAYEFYTTGAGCQYGSTVKARRCKPFYSSSWKGGNHGTHDQLALWGWIKLPCDPHRRHRLPRLPRHPLNLPGEAQLSGNLSLNPRQEVCSTPWPRKRPFSPAPASWCTQCNRRLTSTSKRVPTSHGSCSAGKQIQRGPDQPSAPGFRSPESRSCVLLPALPCLPRFTEEHKEGGKKACQDPRDWA